MPRYRVREHTDSSDLAHLPPMVNRLLGSRGIISKEDAERFLNPVYEELHDPFLLPDMDKAVTRILEAIRSGEKIAVYGDYDCDGIPGAALLHEAFALLGIEVRVYIPHRYLEGYGMNTGAVDTLHGEGVSLLITVDCGIVDHEPVEHANNLGMSVIVTDHHLPQDTLPQAFAVVNPNRGDSEYPNKGLAGTGVAFKLACALFERAREIGMTAPALGQEKWLLDMAGLATIADMVPLTGENRTIASFGLRVMEKTRRPGLRALMKVAGVTRVTEDDVGFLIAPRINAASRMRAPIDALELLISSSHEDAQERARALSRANDERKSLVARITKEAHEHVTEEYLAEHRVIVIGNPLWRPPVLGLVANTLASTYKRPAFVWGREGGEILKGSCRSDGTVNLVELMMKAEHLFVEFGGHSQSGGFALSLEAVSSAARVLSDEYVLLHTPASDVEETIEAMLSPKEITRELVNYVRMCAPYGEGNRKPLFGIEGTVIRSEWWGKEKRHLKLVLKDTTHSVECGAFFVDAQNLTSPEGVSEGASVVVIGSIEEERGRIKVRIKDIVERVH
jgi:single-stranded-DNA-specific exonuclease